MGTKFMIGGNTVHVFKLNNETALDTLPPKVYTVEHNPLEGFYLRIAKNRLELPGKIYGKTPARVQKCIDTYIDRTASTGILLTGDKGTGKSLMMSLLANQMIETQNLPVLIIKQAYAGSQFENFIESIGECVIVFDEFGKMYESNNRHADGEVPQSALLSLMDGIDKTKRMFILTENSELDINEFMLNRPSRVYYHFKYRKLDEESIIGYCTDHTVPADFTKDLVDLSRRTRVFSFDMLQTIVEEHLRYGEPLSAITDELNIDTREDMGAMIEVLKVVEKENNVECELFEPGNVAKPEGSYGYTYIKIKSGQIEEVTQGTGKGKKKNKQPAEDQFEEIYIQDSDLAYESAGQLVYETDEYTVVAKDVPRIRSNYSVYF